MKLTKEQAAKLLNKIEWYEKRKNNDYTDAFYLSDLHIFEQLIKDNTE